MPVSFLLSPFPVFIVKKACLTLGMHFAAEPVAIGDMEAELGLMKRGKAPTAERRRDWNW